MNRFLISSVCICGLLLSGAADAQKKKKKAKKRVSQESVKPVAMKSFVFDRSLWQTKISDFEKNPVNKKFGFKWQSTAMSSLRSVGKGFRMLGINAGETVLISDNDNGYVRGVSISFYNRGDNGVLSMGKFRDLAGQLTGALSGELSSQPRRVEDKRTVNLIRNTWVSDGSTFQLEQSSSGSGAEFLRLRVMSSKQAGRGESTANRTSLRANVVRDKSSGDVYIDNIPMIDQGKKGYCACASAARIYQYYGRTTDQHEIAQLAGSSASGGTSLREMVGSLKKVTNKLNSRVNILYEYPKGLSDNKLDYRTYENGLKEMIRDANSYQQLAKKTGKKSIPIRGEKPYARLSSKRAIRFSDITGHCDPETFRAVMMDKSSFSRFQGKIKEYIDQGIPVGWCLQLGLFPEPGLPQARGGHMRLIIGYNREKKELIYSDSWDVDTVRRRWMQGRHLA